ncbi:MAG: response regulator transcription factor [Burkholderiaceae bacterium]
MIRILLVDDHPVVRAGYQRLLEQAGDIVVVAQADRSDAACAAFAQHQPDVTVTDLAMPGSGGLELIRRLLMRDSSARILVFSMHDSDMLVRRALEVGALGFLSKSSPPEALIDGVRCVACGKRYLDPGLPAGWIDDPSHDSRVASLTPREFEIFRLLARGESPAQCALALSLSSKTISNHQTVIKEKLGVSTTAALVHLAISHGVI